MPNLTVSLNADLLKSAKVYSAEHGVSISKLVRDHLAELTGHGTGTSGDALEDFSRGLIGRKDAMRMLGVTYFELLDMLAKRGLKLPTLPNGELQQMARGMNRLLDEAEG